MPAIDQALGGSRLRAEDRRELNVQHLAGSISGVDHRLRLSEGPRHRLLTVHVLPGFERIDRDWRVQAVVQAHVHRVDVISR